MKAKELRELLQGIDGEKEVYLVEMYKQQFDSDLRCLKKVNSIKFEKNGITLEK
nr:MAG TPA: hypothetical protein [Caudoviricetes sp.]